MTRQTLELRPLNEDDAPFGMRLSEAAGWNQTLGDWQRAIRLADGGAWAAVLQGRDAGTVTTCRFGSVGWIGLLLVDPDLRRRGIGRRLLEQALHWLDARGATTHRLDATPLGRPLYEQHGFQVDFELIRYAGVVQASVDVDAGREPTPPIAPVNGASDAQLVALAELDRRCTRVDRTSLLRAWLSDSRATCFAVRDGERETADDLQAYLVTRPGRLAVQIGPCVGRTPAAAASLLVAALARLRGQAVFVDVPVDNAAAARIVRSAGLAPARTLVRMTRGPQVGELLDEYWVSGGPEKG